MSVTRREVIATLAVGGMAALATAGGGREERVDLPKDDPLLQAIQARLGKPDRVSGSGRMFLHYDLQNGSTLTLAVSDGRVIGIEYKTKP